MVKVLLHAAVWGKGEMAGRFRVSPHEKSEPPFGLRRRLSPLGKQAFKGYDGLSRSQDFKKMPWVVSCRHGDTHRMIRLIEDIEEGALLSPTDFSFSVHNALVGMMGVEEANTYTHSAIAAGVESFHQGLLEAVVFCATEKRRCGFLYYDLPVASPFNELAFDEKEPVYIGMILVPSAPEGEFHDMLCFSITDNSIFFESNLLNKIIPSRNGVDTFVASLNGLSEGKH